MFNRTATCACLMALALPLAALPASAQSAQSGQTQQQKDKEKKVWTNDDLSQLTGFVTTASAAPAPAPADAQPAAAQDGDKQLSNEQDPKWYRSKLEPLRAQLADFDGKIKDIEDALKNPGDNGKNAIKINQQAPNFPKSDQDPGYQEKRPDDKIFGNETVRPQDQLTVFKQKRDAVQQQIDDLESLARRNGISPGDIR